MIKTTVPIRGMHCKSCEILITEGLTEIHGVKNVKVSFKQQTAEIYSKQSLAPADIKNAVEKAGYKIGAAEAKGWFSTNHEDYIDLGIGILVAAILYFILSQLGLTTISFGQQSDNYSSLSVVLLVGLTAGVSTCMAMVGGLILGISARHSEKHPESTAIQKFRPLSLIHI